MGSTIQMNGQTASYQSRWGRAGFRGLALALCTLLCLALSASPAGAASHPRTRLDQAQTMFAGGLSVRMLATQTLTVGLTGHLTRVDLPLCTFIRGSEVQLSVTEVTRRHPARATSALTFSKSFSDCIWFSFMFKRPLSVRKGEVLQLRVSVLRGKAPLWASNAYSKIDPYRRGSGKWMGHIINDFAFRTYVQA